jgi:hypothetical protein
MRKRYQEIAQPRESGADKFQRVDEEVDGEYCGI